MPFYEYQCTHCGHRLEILQKISDPPMVDCPSCHDAALKKLISASAFHLKGSGWYVTDFKNNDKKKEEPAKQPATGSDTAGSDPAPKSSESGTVTASPDSRSASSATA